MPSHNMSQASRSAVEVRDLASITITQLAAAPVVSLDLRFEALKVTAPQGFLDSVVQTVNQHAQVIKLVTSEMRGKAGVTDVSEAFTLLGSSLPSSLFEAPPPPADVGSVREAAVRAAKGVSALGKHVVKLKEFEDTTNQTLSDLRRQLTTKASLDHVKDKVKKSRKKVEHKLDARCKELNTAIDNLRAALWDKVNAQDKKIVDLEMNTLWKLKDVEELLKIRVNEKFVWDAINATLGKGKKDLKDLETELEGKMNRWGRDLQEHIETVENTDHKSTTELRELLQQLELRLNGKVGEEQHQSLSDRVEEVLREANPREIRQKLEELMSKIDKLTQRLNAFGENEQLRKELDWLNNELKRLSERINTTQEDLVKKVDTEKFKEELSKLLAGLPKGSPGPHIDPSELAILKDRLLDMIKALEKKFEKFARSLDLKGILSELGLKANAQEVMGELGRQNSTLMAHEQAINDLAREFEQLKISIQKVIMMVQDTNVTSNSLVSRRPLSGNTCLSCGRGEAKFAPMLPAVMGSDGRVYRADGNLMKVTSGPISDFEPMYDVGAEVFSMDTHEQAHLKPPLGPEDLRSSKMSVQLSPHQSRSQTLRAPLNVILGTARTERKSGTSSARLRPQSAKK